MSGKAQAAGHAVRSVRVLAGALILALSIGGFVLTTATIRGDRDADARRRAETVSVRAQTILETARTYLVSLGGALAGERVAGQRRFEQLQGSAAGAVGLTGALWVQRVPAAGRRAYERRLGAPITRLTPGGGYRRAPPAPAYRPATYVTGTLARRGVDVSTWPVLGPAIRDPASVFAGTATRTGRLGGRTGFFLLEVTRFGRAGRGILVVFVPSGWLGVGLGEPLGRYAVALEDRPLDGRLTVPPAARRSFAALGRTWHVAIARRPRTGLETLLPWLALAWPPAVAALAFLVAGGVLRRRRAERDAERIFTLSLDLLCVARIDGRFVRVNPAFERTLGYSSEELLSRPLLDFVHPEDRAATTAALEALGRGEEVVQYENRYLRADGTTAWLQWSVRPIAAEGLVYGAARDVTEHRRAQDALRRAQGTIEASRDELRVLAAEQAALRRIATLVARGAAAHDVFRAVAQEISRLLGADVTEVIGRDEDDAQVLAAHGEGVPVDVAGATKLSAPIVVEGRRWGRVTSAWRDAGAVPPDAEERMTQFTELVATAIANAESRAELTASRARIVAATDETRRRIERDLHDGTQQRLVTLALALRAAEGAVPPGNEALGRELAATAEGLATVVAELQEISRGIHPAILSRGGLGPALKGLARRSAVPVELDVSVDARLPEPVEVAAYYVVSEALTNAVKHAGATVVTVTARASDGVVELVVRDDGSGGADPAAGSGLVGLRDRVEALGGTIEIHSRQGAGTSISARIPVRPPALAS